MFVDNGTQNGTYENGDGVVRVTRETTGESVASLDEATLEAFAADVGYASGGSDYADGDPIYRDGDGGRPGDAGFGDTVRALSVSNDGSLSDEHLSAVTLYRDGSRIASSTTTAADGSWVFSDLDAALSPAGVDFEVRASIAADAPAGETLNFSVDPVDDPSSDGAFDAGDRGLFFGQDDAVGGVGTDGAITVENASSIRINATSYVDRAIDDRARVEVAFGRDIDPASTNASDFVVETATGTADVSALSDDDGDGRLTLALSSGVRSGDVGTVRIADDALRTDSGGAIPARNVSVTAASVTVREAAGVDANRTAVRGERVATLAASEGETIEVRTPDNQTVFEAVTGPNSRLAVFDTAGRDRDAYSVAFGGGALDTNNDGADDDGDGSVDEDATVALSSLALNASVANTSITDDGAIAGTVTAAVGDRPVTVAVTGPNGNVRRSRIALNQSGAAQFGVDPFSHFGTYSIEVTDVDTGIHAATADVRVEDVTLGAIDAEERGDVVEIPLRFNGTDTATVQIGTLDDGYEANVTVVDGGDGAATIEWNTYLADGHTPDEAFSTVSASDAVRVDADRVRTDVAAGPSHVLAAGAYPIRTFPGSSVGSSPVDTATGRVDSRSTPASRLRTAPSDVLDAVNRAAEEDRLGVVDDAIENGSLTRSNRVAAGDVLAIELNMTGFSGLVAAEGDNTTDALVAGARGDPELLNLTLAAADVPTLSLGNASDTLDRGALTAVADADADTYYLLLDTRDIDLSSGTAYDARFSLRSYNDSATAFGLVAPDDGRFSDERVSSSITVESDRATVDTNGTGIVELSSGSNATLSGTTTLAAGTDLNVSVESIEGSTQSFRTSRSVTVDRAPETNTWSTTVDVVDDEGDAIDPGVEFAVDVCDCGARTDSLLDGGSTDSVVRGSTDVTSLDVTDQTSAGSTDNVRVDRVELTDGGFLAFYRMDDDSLGSRIGTSEYVEPGATRTDLETALDRSITTDVTVAAAPYLDTNDDGRLDATVDERYTENGSGVRVLADVTIETTTDGSDGSTSDSTDGSSGGSSGGSAGGSAGGSSGGSIGGSSGGNSLDGGGTDDSDPDDGSIGSAGQNGSTDDTPSGTEATTAQPGETTPRRPAPNGSNPPAGSAGGGGAGVGGGGSGVGVGTSGSNAGVDPNDGPDSGGSARRSGAAEPDGSRSSADQRDRDGPPVTIPPTNDPSRSATATIDAPPGVATASGAGPPESAARSTTASAEGPGFGVIVTAVALLCVGLLARVQSGSGR